MKKLFLLSAALLMGLSSCTKDEATPAPDQKITFSSPLVGSVTKAVPGEIGTNYDKSESFIVNGWYTAGNFDPANSSVYMNEVKVSHNASINVGSDAGDQGAWVPEYTYYWPKNGKLTFSAYSPADATGTINFDAVKGLTITDFAVDSDVTKQYDLLYSDRAYNKVTSLGEINSTYDGVDIQFRHALSSIVVRVKMDKAYAGNPIKVTKIWFENVCCKGNFNENLTTGLESESLTTSAWNGQYDQKEILIGNSEVYPVWSAEQGAQYGTTALLIPQSFDKDQNEIVLKVNYTIINGDGTNASTIDQVAEFKLKSGNYTGSVEGATPSDVITQWTKGYRYTYNIVFGLQEVYFAPSVAEWKDVLMDNLTI